MWESGVNNTLLKQQNRGLVLKLIATGACSSRIGLSQKTGLAKMTVTYIVNEFLENGVLEEREKVQSGGKGRNPIQLCISSRAPKLLGVNVYRERCTVILCDLQLHVIKRSAFVITKENAAHLLQNIFGAVDKMLESFPEEEIYGIGIGAIGPVDILQGKILEPPNFYGLHDLELKKEIENRYSMPVFFDGESNCAAITEKYYGNGRDCGDFIYLDLANGVGAGLVVNGKLYTNASGMICELGHTSIDWKGVPCGCGNRGCLERYISSNVIERKLRETLGEDKTFREFCLEMDEAIRRGETGGTGFTEREEKLHAVFCEMAEKLACGLTSFANGLNPQKIVIGHEGYWIPDLYLRQAERQVNQCRIARKYRKIQIVKSNFQSEATVLGCVGALLTAVFEGSLF